MLAFDDYGQVKELSPQEALQRKTRLDEKFGGPGDLREWKDLSQEELDRVDGLLKAALSEVDRFWVRWTAYRRSLAGKP